MVKKKLDELVSHLYRSAASIPPDQYRTWALEQIAQVIDFDAAFWGTGNWESGHFHYTHHLGLDDNYGEKLVQTLSINPIKEGVLSNLGSVVDMADVSADDDFYQSEIFEHLFKPYNIERILASGHEDKRSGLYTLLSLYRFDRDNVFTVDERALQQQLIFHLVSAASHAFFIHLQLVHHNDESQQSAVAICDREGCFHEAQPKFLQLLNENVPDRSSMSLPFEIPTIGTTVETNNLIISAKAIGELFLVQLRLAGPIDVLTEREKQIVELICKGLSFKEAAKVLQLAPSTVSNHLYRIYDKLGISSRGELARLVGS